jgi:hypothetical protein
VESYLNFDLRIDPPAQGNDVHRIIPEQQYQVRVLDTPAGRNLCELFTLPFAGEALDDFLQRLRGFQTTRSEIAEFGRNLFSAVFVGEVHQCYEASRAIADQQRAGLRMRLQLDETPWLAELPWEYLYDTKVRDNFMFVSVEMSLMRYSPLPERPPLPVQPPLKMLVMISAPRGLPGVDVEREWTMLQKATMPLSEQGKLRLDLMEEATLRELQQRLLNEEYHIFHFIGHGGFDARRQEGLLLFTEPDGRARQVNNDQLSVLLSDNRTLCLAVLNTCEGARSSGLDYYAGTAQTLVRRGVPAVIAMQSQISIDAALTFSDAFYRTLASGFPVDTALAEARKALYIHGNDIEWGTPALFTRVQHGQILDISDIDHQETGRSAEVAPSPAGSVQATHEPSPPVARWTLLVHAVADSSANPTGTIELAAQAADLQEFMRALVPLPQDSSEQINVVVQIVQSGAGPNDNGSILRLRMSSEGEQVQLAGPSVWIEPGASDALADFLRWGTAEYRAMHHALILINRRAGWHRTSAFEALSNRLGGGATRAWWERVLFTTTLTTLARQAMDTSAGVNGAAAVFLDVRQLRTALEMGLREANQPLDLLICDGCLLNSLDVAYELRTFVRTLVASQSLTIYLQLPYTALSFLLQQSGIGHAVGAALQGIRRFVSAQDETLPPTPLPFTLSAVDTRQLENLAGAVNALAAALLPHLRESSLRDALAQARERASVDKEFVDLLSLAQSLIETSTLPQEVHSAAEAVKKAAAPGGAVVVATVPVDAYGQPSYRANGLSIYLPAAPAVLPSQDAVKA